MGWPDGSAEDTVRSRTCNTTSPLVRRIGGQTGQSGRLVFSMALPGKLVGSIEANLAYCVIPGQVNISYGVFRGWRRKGIARRALN
jgi:hypothetical protein